MDDERGPLVSMAGQECLIIINISSWVELGDGRVCMYVNRSTRPQIFAELGFESKNLTVNEAELRIPCPVTT
jgi:hypothetical protein